MKLNDDFLRKIKMKMKKISLAGNLHHHVYLIALNCQTEYIVVHEKNISIRCISTIQRH